MNLINYMNRPEYIFQPRQIFKRLLLRQNKNNLTEFQDILLPWGTKFQVSLSSNNKTDHALLLQGIYDLSLTEVIWRLLMPEETALDIGANIGYVTSLMASRVDRNGKVICFEPNPDVYKQLCSTIEALPQVIPSQFALSNQSGTATLVIEPNNIGEAHLTGDTESINSENSFQVHKVRLDEVIEVSQIHLMKIDVEGHELEVLEGAGDWIAKGRVRDIVFEEHKPYPNETTQFLESFGYTVFRIKKSFWKPRLISPKQFYRHPWEPPNYLASVEPDRAKKLLNDYGWKSLRKL